MSDTRAPIETIYADLDYSEMGGTRHCYHRNGDRIRVEEYSDDGTTATTIGYLTFTEVTP